MAETLPPSRAHRSGRNISNATAAVASGVRSITRLAASLRCRQGTGAPAVRFEIRAAIAISLFAEMERFVHGVA